MDLQLSRGIQRIVRFPVDFQWKCRWRFPMDFHFSEFWRAIFCPEASHARQTRRKNMSRFQGPPEYGRSCDYSEQVIIIAYYSL